ncbi:hypothetical protein A3K72_00170 [Candidatus Woesearchaeota archaeon RBG_13_36_6]|nr:MAG: hypothetical protein A3K72_00170 [Candidatus Woesearchaeota archaeon RBG_13_36_6]
MVEIADSSFLDYLQKGQIKIKDGNIVFFGFDMIFIPAKSYAILHHSLRKEFGKKAADNFCEAGKKHMENIIATYAKRFDLSKMDFQTFSNLFTPSTQTFGFGKIIVKKIDIKKGFIVVRSENNPYALVYKEMYGIQQYDVDDLLRGMFAGASELFNKKQSECIETKCIAKGDTYCEFVAKPID